MGDEGHGGSPFDQDRIVAAVERSLDYAPGPPYVVNFIENHDTTRFASLVESAAGPLRAAAALNLLLPGIPSIYYGQEVGMTGAKLANGPDSDGVDIPKREAFPWSADIEADGMTYWYKDSGPWWDVSMYHSPAVASLVADTQRADPDSLWNVYRELIELRKSRIELRRGNFTTVDVGDEDLFAFRRDVGENSVVVMINLSGGSKAIVGVEIDPWGYVVLDNE